MILPEHKLIFIHIPKTGGVSVENFLLKQYNFTRSISTFTHGYGHVHIHTKNKGGSIYPLMHYPLYTLVSANPDIKIDNSWTIFAIVRNPYYKFISELFWEAKTGMCLHYHTLPDSSKKMFLNYAIDLYFNELDAYSNYHSFHSYPQSWFFNHTDLNCQIFKFEEGLPNIMSKLGFEVTNFPHSMNIFEERLIPRPNYKELLTSYLIETINEKYAIDFEEFGYEMLDPLDFS